MCFYDKVIIIRMRSFERRVFGIIDDKAPVPLPIRQRIGHLYIAMLFQAIAKRLSKAFSLTDYNTDSFLSSKQISDIL